jgi:hypothetical protein
MHNLSDKELDHLSKEAADNFEAAAGPAMWDKIQKKLDAEMPVQKKGKKRFFWLYIVSGLLILSLIIGNEKFSGADQINRVIKADGYVSGLSQKTAEPSVQKDNKQGFTDAKDSNIDPLFPGLKNNIATDRNKVSFQKKEKQFEEPMKVNSVKSLHADELTQSGMTFKKPASALTDELLQKKVNDLSFKDYLEPAGQTEKELHSSTLKIVDPLREEKKVNSFSTSAATDSGSKSNSLSLKKKPLNGDEIKPKIKSNKLKRFEISGVFGPDFSNVGFVSPEKTGINLGLMIGYRFTERFTVQTGVLHSRKHYTAVGEAYKGYPGVNLNNNYVKMDWVDANCLMWDIPVNARYDLLLRKKQRAFISAGLSSYIMSKEDLQYHFRYYGYPGYRAWSNQENKSYWLSVINLSVGYEQRISTSFSFQAEPFLKIPTREMGYGNINLNSLGILLSLKYTPAPYFFKTKKTGKSL